MKAWVANLRDEPFRLFFPLGVVLAWVGIGHWLLYALSLAETYSCLAHGLAVAQGFLVAFAAGFLMTAVPRRTASAPPSAVEVCALAVLLILTTTAAAGRWWRSAEIAYAAALALLLRFVAVRFAPSRAARRPPASFVLIPMGLVAGIAGAALIATCSSGAAGASWLAMGRLLTEQGVFLCFALGAGALILPLVRGTPPPRDLGSAAAEWARAGGYLLAGLTIVATFALEACGWVHVAPVLRAGAVAASGLLGGGMWRPPQRPGLHRRLVWLAGWMMPLGLAASGLAPDYRVPALHVLFIGGFSVLAFGVATHVSFGHLGLERLAEGRSAAVVAVGAGLLLALASRVAADFSHTYFDHLGWAAACWIGGSAVWLVRLGPRFVRKR